VKTHTNRDLIGQQIARRRERIEPDNWHGPAAPETAQPDAAEIEELSEFAEKLKALEQ